MKTLLRLALLVVLAGIALGTSAAGFADQVQGFEATVDPAAVKPSSVATYTIAVKNEAGSFEANQVSVAIPAGFTIEGAVTAEVATGDGGNEGCTGTWTITGENPIVAQPAEGVPNLCAGATLTITFAKVTAPAASGAGVWTTSVRKGSSTVTLAPKTIVDGTPPSSTIDCNGGGCGGWFTTSPVQVHIAATDEAGGSGVREIRYTTNGGDPTAGTIAPGAAVTFPVSGTETTVTVKYAVYDNAGNVTVQSQTIAIDTVAPPAPEFSSTPPSLSLTSAATFTFTDGESDARFECRLDTSAFAACSETVSYHGLPNGAHTFEVKAFDPAGNASESATFTWTVKTAVPQPTISSGPPALTRSTRATFGFADAVAATFSCSLDGGAYSACSSPTTYTGLRDGRHTFAVVAKVEAESPAAVYTWTVDTTPPQTAISSGPASVTRDRAAAFAFGSDSAGSTFQCSIDAGAFASCAAPRLYSGLTAGTHAFRVRAIDPAGNVDATPAVRQWTVDLLAPAAARRLVAAVGYRTLTLTWQLPADPDFDHVVVLRSGPGDATATAVLSGRTTTYRERAFTNGILVRYTVVAYDHVGNASQAASRSVLPSALLLSPRDGAAIRRAPMLRWRSVTRAAYYNVQLYRNGRKVLTAWPKRARLRLHARWTYAGKRERLRRGRYVWWVWPAYRAASGSRYGPAIGVSRFRVR